VIIGVTPAAVARDDADPNIDDDEGMTPDADGDGDADASGDGVFERKAGDCKNTPEPNCASAAAVTEPVGIELEPELDALDVNEVTLLGGVEVALPVGVPDGNECTAER
jgi:hypothetical protein